VERENLGKLRLSFQFVEAGGAVVVDSGFLTRASMVEEAYTLGSERLLVKGGDM